MILRKCTLAGLLALLIAAIVLPMGVCVYFSWALHPGGNEFIGFNLTAATRSPSVWIIAVLAFSLGFDLE